jgi:hypothetical protein
MVGGRIDRGLRNFRPAGTPWPARSAAPHRAVQVSVTWSVNAVILPFALWVSGSIAATPTSSTGLVTTHDVVAHLLTGSLPESSQASCRRLG